MAPASPEKMANIIPRAPHRWCLTPQCAVDVRPLFVSPGHLCDHDNCVDWVLACGTGYRMPEPTRLADRLVAAYKRTGQFRGGICRS